MFNLNSPLRTLRLVSLMGETRIYRPSSVVLKYRLGILPLFGTRLLQSDRRKCSCGTETFYGYIVHLVTSWTTESQVVTVHAGRICRPGRVAQSVGHLIRKSAVLGSIPGLATYFRFSFRFFKKGSCQLL